MEFLLQWYDNLDDLGGTIGFMWHKIAGFLVACTLFVATGALCLYVPQLLLAVAAVTLSAGLYEAARTRRSLTQASADR